MASRYGAFARSARSAFYNGGRSFRQHNMNESRSYIPTSQRKSFQCDSYVSKRRAVQTYRMPFHDVVASAKLVSRLAFNSRSCSSLSLCNFLCPQFPFFLCLPGINYML
eukprot:TRINITY_DN38044_c0_g1_i1.p2 TRINITY_DN38044_c0_g1~~TRINITY_DN38044_c0_g1_i1.p2  ORF type:complete len:109 (+),score=10.38 TRINITY_DN38044_c0_g1_i1:119-445(+)